MDCTWNKSLSETEIYGREVTFKEINPKDKEYACYQQAAHVLLFAPTTKNTFEIYARRAIVFMQMRFDGYIGFPGGLVDAGEDPVFAVNRELLEEINYDVEKFGSVTQNDHLFSHVACSNKLVLHFYAKELTEEQMVLLDQESLKAKDYGCESLGLIQVPLYTMGDSYRGFPSFLKNNFVGNAKEQLVDGLVRLKIISDDYARQSLDAKPKSV